MPYYQRYEPLPIDKIDMILECRFWNKINRPDDIEICWLFPIFPSYDEQNCRPKFRIGKKTYYAARIAYYLHYKIDPGEFQVCHKCPDGDNPLCMNPHHLWLGTIEDNQRDSRDKGRIYTGANPKYPDDIVRKVRELFKTGNYSMADLSKTFDIPSGTIFHFVNYTNRKNI